MKLRFSRAMLVARAVAVAAVLAVAGACVPGTSGPSQPAQNDSGPLTLEFWTINLKKSFGDYVQGLVDKYQQQHPNVTITWVDVPGNDVGPKLLSAIASRQAPDVVNLANADIDQFVPSLTDLGRYLPPDVPQKYQPNLIDPLRRDGKLVALPWYNAGAPISLINTDLVRQAGLDPAAPPKTFDEALDWGAKIHAAVPGAYGMNGLPDENILRLEGIDMLTPDRKHAAFNTPDAVAVLEKWRHGMESGAISPGSTVKDDRQYPQTLANQQVAFGANAIPTSLTSLQKNAPDVFAKIGVAPGAVGKTGKYLLPDQQTMVVPAGSRHPETASDFAAFVTNAENQTEFCKLTPIYPSHSDALKNPFFSQSGGTTPMDRARAEIATELPKLELSTLGTGKDRQLSDRFREHIRAFMSGDKTAAQALTDAEKEWNDLLAQ
ncbi:sugar ABC transporter substrate-binding protein [Amycolatopsis taiwanensis]|uniref:Sugar ABC transporter substrate-binding protein n=2 Tax=Amycolatopsis taiwanensis TaxID=342230 RepID=A0A9W6RA38_9PSEU|nr:sugar ABC transporter substrate-binding protein [Amycolatopsis taiwanensis]